ncbi:hypothetical protein PuT2_11985 [Pusillimonas sp. T2]|uniref:phage integrase family protein n=1 Tax=Pusillimonas sp. T2 TaxID=1548123 RepID=UPI000B9CEFCA|nr:phage integrase family protein [Pusillimonas sp. T2]OXR48680.1 hypothetical protein PuT2_11985 [Pusillimonas sp. T2]
MPAIENLIPTRYVGLHHIALFRAFFEESLNLADIADRYLETGRDLVAARRTLLMVQDALIAAGMRKNHDLDALELLRVPEAVVRGLRDFAALNDSLGGKSVENNRNEQSEHSLDDQESAPNFEDFVAAYDPDGFFSQEEQLEHYYEHYPSALKVDRQRYGQQALEHKVSALNYLDDRAEATASGQVSATGQDRARELAHSSAQHLRRLAARVRLINELEPVAAAEPSLDDQVFGWFDPRVALRLAHAGLNTLGDIVDCANHAGYRWFNQVPKLGEHTAVRILGWLRHHESALGCEIMPWAYTARSQLTNASTGGDLVTVPGSDLHSTKSARQPALIGPRTDQIAPLERFVVPARLDGSAGTNRYPTERNRLEASNDYEAVHIWLNRYRHSPNTFMSYRKEVERLLLWAIKARGKPLSSLGVQDANDYVQFLFDPQPASLWVATKRYERYHPLWRPFVNKNRPADRDLTPDSKTSTPVDLLHDQPSGSMTRDSIKLSLTIISNMFNWLVGQLYLETNPFAALPNFRSNRQIKAHRSFSQRQWDVVIQHLEQLDLDDRMNSRLAFIIRFGFGTGLRLNELVRIRTSDFEIGDLGAELHDVWFLNVRGKGQKERQIPLARVLVRETQRYLVDLGLPDDPRQAPTALPLFPSTRDKLKPIYHSVIYRQLKEFFNSVARNIQDESPSLAKHFLKASTHWLRHTHGSLAVEKGVSLPTVMESLGHASLKTTSIYARAQEARRLQEMEKFLGDD